MVNFLGFVWKLNMFGVQFKGLLVVVVMITDTENVLKYRVCCVVQYNFA